MTEPVMILVALFVVALVIGTVVRAARAPKGARFRAAFSPYVGALEKHQELHTGQRGVQDVMIEAVHEQEHGGRAGDRGDGAAER
ncbi:hypothetical protein ABIQ69_01755 [Agromyces sp. G08B096]|uniref:Secreted protein n=1 Tax=Agromyces sp. G08B096 TaxID=3156399 RepID=A0AAU7W7R9_9MICO